MLDPLLLLCSINEPILIRWVLNRSGELGLDGPFRFASRVRQAASLSLFLGYFRVGPTVEHPTSWQLVGLPLLYPHDG